MYAIRSYYEYLGWKKETRQFDESKSLGKKAEQSGNRKLVNDKVYVVEVNDNPNIDVSYNFV